MSHRAGSLGFSKWQLALVIGAPLAFGIGVYVFNKVKATKSSDDLNNKNNSKASNKKSLGAKQESLSIDGTTEDKDLERKVKRMELESEKLSPFKEAMMYKNDGNNCYRNGKYDEAISFYDKAIDKCPTANPVDMAIFYQNRAAAYEMLKKWNQVKIDCTKSIEYNPRYSKAYFRRAKAHEATNQILDCLDDITATCILEMFQNNTSILFADRILKITGSNDADKFFKDRKPVLPSEHSITTYLDSFVKDPIVTMSMPQTLDSDGQETTTPLKGFLRAKRALDTKQYDDVIPACTEEIESSESDAEYAYKPEALLLRGTFHLLSSSFNDALQDLSDVINNADIDKALRVNALVKRGSLYIQTDERDLSFEDFKTAEKLDSESADVYHQRAQILMLLDKSEEALAEYTKALKYAPNHCLAYIQKCYCEYRLAIMGQDGHRLLRVMNDFRNAVEKYPNSVESYSLLAQVLADQQQFPQADEFYQKAMDKSPKNASLLVHRGIMELQWRGDVVKALEYLNRAIEVDEKCELAYETLGTVEVQRANLDRAVELFDLAVKCAKSRTEVIHLFALRNAAIAQINITRKLGIDIATITALAQNIPVTAPVATATIANNTGNDNWR